FFAFIFIFIITISQNNTILRLGNRQTEFFKNKEIFFEQANKKRNLGQRVPSGSNGDQGAQQGQQGQQQQILFVGGGDGGDMSPYPPLNKVLAPDFGVNTFIFMITCVQIIFFICELIVGQAKYSGAFVKDNDMAGPDTDTFIAMGAKYLPDIQKGE
ncbi:hypothetical protein RFI_33561, partial [Reticulomyxa filosa]